MYAVIKTGGKQHKVKAGDVIEVEKIVHEGETVTFQPLLVVDDDGTRTRRRGREGDGHGEAVGREEGRQDQDLQVPAEDRVRAAGRSPPAAHAARDRDVTLGPSVLEACTPYGTQEGRRLVPQRPRLEREATRREGLRRPDRHRGLDHRAPARHADPPGRGVGKGGDDTLFALRDGPRDVLASPAGASTPRSCPAE